MQYIDETCVQIISYYCDYEDIISLHSCNSILYYRKNSVILKPLIERSIIKLYNNFTMLAKTYTFKLFIPDISIIYLENILFDELIEIYKFLNGYILNGYILNGIKIELREATDEYYEKMIHSGSIPKFRMGRNISFNFKVENDISRILTKERDFILNTIKTISESLFEDLITGGIRYSENVEYDTPYAIGIDYIISYNFLYLFKIYLNKFPDFLEGWEIYFDTIMICTSEKDISRLEYLIYELKYPCDYNTDPDMILYHINNMYDSLSEYNITKEKVDILYKCAKELFED